MTLRIISALFLLIGPSAGQIVATKLRGTVIDETTKQPIAGAMVAATGDRSRQPEITDNRGFFRLTVQGVQPGDLVRIRVTKDGYIPHDQQVIASEKIPLSIALRRSESIKRTIPKRPNQTSSISSQFIEQLKSPDPKTRLNAIEFLERAAGSEPTAVEAIVNATTDPDSSVRQRALIAIAKLKLTTKKAIEYVIFALKDQSSKVAWQAAETLGKLGSAGRQAIPALLDALRWDGDNSAALWTLLAFGVHDKAVIHALALRAFKPTDLLRAGGDQEENRR